MCVFLCLKAFTHWRYWQCCSMHARPVEGDVGWLPGMQRMAAHHCRAIAACSLGNHCNRWMYLTFDCTVQFQCNRSWGRFNKWENWENSAAKTSKTLFLWKLEEKPELNLSSCNHCRANWSWIVGESCGYFVFSLMPFTRLWRLAQPEVECTPCL